jgi:TonB family protein
MVSFVVGADGAVGQASVVSSSDTALDALSLAAVEVLRFTPGSVAGTPVATRVAMPIQWQAPPPTSPIACEGAANAAPGDDPARVYGLPEVEERPRPVNVGDTRETMRALLPADLRASRVEARVWVRFRIDCAGMPRDLSILESTNLRFNGPSLRSVATMRFTPARLNGRTVQVWVVQPVHW